MPSTSIAIVSNGVGGGRRHQTTRTHLLLAATTTAGAAISLVVQLLSDEQAREVVCYEETNAHFERRLQCVASAALAALPTRCCLWGIQLSIVPLPVRLRVCLPDCLGLAARLARFPHLAHFSHCNSYEALVFVGLPDAVNITRLPLDRVSVCASLRLRLCASVSPARFCFIEPILYPRCCCCCCCRCCISFSLLSPSRHNQRCLICDA